MPGPGEYVPDATEGITRVEDLPEPRIHKRSRNFAACPCPTCHHPAGRSGFGARTLHDLSDTRSGRPLDLVVTFARHRCRPYGRHFTADLTDFAPPNCLDTCRVQRLAVRLVAEDGLAYRTASRHLWRDYRVTVPLRHHPELGGGRGGKKPTRLSPPTT